MKPGDNLEGALAELERRVSAGEPRIVPQPPARRTTRTGRLAHVRRPTTIRGRNYATATVKRQAAGSGGKALAHTIDEAAEGGRRVAVTVSYDKSVTVIADSSGKARGSRKGKGGSVVMELDDADDALAEIEDEWGGNVVAYLHHQAEERGYVRGGDWTHARSVEVRSW